MRENGKEGEEGRKGGKWRDQWGNKLEPFNFLTRESTLTPQKSTSGFSITPPLIAFFSKSSSLTVHHQKAVEIDQTAGISSEGNGTFFTSPSFLGSYTPESDGDCL